MKWHHKNNTVQAIAPSPFKAYHLRPIVPRRQYLTRRVLESALEGRVRKKILVRGDIGMGQKLPAVSILYWFFLLESRY